MPAKRSRSKSSRKSRSKVGRPRKVVSAAKRRQGKKAFSNIKPWFKASSEVIREKLKAKGLKKGTKEYGMGYKKLLISAKRGSKLYKEIKSRM